MRLVKTLKSHFNNKEIRLKLLEHEKDKHS